MISSDQSPGSPPVPSAPASKPADDGGGPAPRTIDELLTSAATSAAGRIVFPAEQASAAELEARADAFARRLRARGVPVDAKVAIWLPPSLQMIAAIFGAIRAGCVPVPVSDRFRAGELRHAILAAEASAIVTTDCDEHLDRVAVLGRALPELDGATQRLSISQAPLLREVILAEALSADDGDTPSRATNETAMLMFTSGTSAAAKACVLEHRTLLDQARALADDCYLLGSESVVWTPLPLFHIAGFVALLATLHAGAAFVHSAVFSPETTLTLIERERPTHALAAFETIWMRLLDRAEEDRADLSSLAVGLSANGEEQIRKLHARFPRVAFIANYGSTEGSGHVAMARSDEPEALRLSGSARPLPGAEIRIALTGTDEPAPTGELGEIQFRGRYLFAGYYEDPEANADAFTADGWFRSGDLGTLNSESRLTFRGRLKDMLKVGGENVSATEVETFLTTHPAVNVCAVVGVADEYYGEVAAAFVQRAPGATVSETELIAYSQENIASFKVPRYVRFVDEWPMSGTKIRKAELIQALTGELREAGITQAPRLARERRLRSEPRGE